MDYGANQILDKDSLVRKYIKENYGDVPQLVGIRLMEKEERTRGLGTQMAMFDKYVGEQVIYFHTKCGISGLNFNDENSNYRYFKADEWEKEHEDTYLDHFADKEDSNYCDHYFKAVVNEDYNELLRILY